MVYVQGGLSGIHIGGRSFGGLGMQGQPDGSSVSNILKVHSLNREQDQERISLKEGSSLHTLRQGRSLISHLHQNRERLESDQGVSDRAMLAIYEQ